MESLKRTFRVTFHGFSTNLALQYVKREQPLIGSLQTSNYTKLGGFTYWISFAPVFSFIYC